MAFLQDWFRRPQGFWFRKAFFQIHLWTGIGAGLYIVAVCLSGSAVVFRAELSDYLMGSPKTVAVSARRLTNQELQQIAEREHPTYLATRVLPSDKPNQAVEIWLSQIGSGIEIRREFNPYNGKDLGDRAPLLLVLFTRLVDFHGNLGFGANGRIVNGVGALVVVLLCLTGIVIWWPGIGKWRHSLTVRMQGGWRRINWELHSTVGFWTFVIVLMFAITGTSLVFTGPFERAVNAMFPLRVYCSDLGDYSSRCDDSGPSTATTKVDPATGEILDASSPDSEPTLTVGDEMVRWAPRLHYGRFSNFAVKILWVVLGLAPPLLFCTGALMWWNRVLGPELRRSKYSRTIVRLKQ